MNDPLVRSQPSELLFIGHLVELTAKVSHDFFNIPSLEHIGIECSSLADEIISLAQSEGEADTDVPLVIDQFGNGVRVNRIPVDRVATGSMFQCETPVFNNYPSDHMVVGQ